MYMTFLHASTCQPEQRPDCGWQNHLHGACWEWCLLFQKLLPFHRLKSGGQTEGRGFIILALTFLCSKSMTCLDGIFTFGLGITFIGAPVFFWIFSAWTEMRFQARQCVQQRSARRAGVLRHDCLIRMLYFHFETPRKFGKVAAERRRLLHRDGTPRERCKAEVCYIFCKYVIY